MSHELDSRGTAVDGSWSSQCLEPDSECPTSCTDLPGRTGVRCYECDDTVKPVCDDDSKLTSSIIASAISVMSLLLFVHFVNYCVTSRREWALLSFPDVCPDVCLSVCHSTTYSLPRLTDHNQIWYAGTYLSSNPCKPFWIPSLPYSRFQMEKYGKFRLFRTLNGYHFDIRTQIKKSRCESTRMSVDSIVPKY